jgi:hypothetical protein
MAKLGQHPREPSYGQGTTLKSPVSHAKFGLSGGGKNNEPILLASGSANQTLIHSCALNAMDEVYLWASVEGGLDAKVYVSIDGGSSVAFINEISAESGLVQIAPGIPHMCTKVTAWANNKDVLRIMGYVARHYPVADYTNTFGFDGTE